MNEMLGTDARALIDQAAGGDDPSTADRDRMRARLAVALVATTGTFAVTSAAKVATSSLAPASASAAASGAATVGSVGAVGTVGTTVGLGMKIVLGAALVSTLAGAGGLVASQRRASSPPVAPVAMTAVPVAAPVTPAPVAAPVATAAPAETPSPASEAVLPAAHPAAVNAAPAAASTPDVADELVLLREARSALKAGDPDRSLHLLAEHARRFPHGALTEEREAARAVASCARVDAGGTVDEAHAAVARFFRAYPRSLHASRVHAACDAIDAH